MATPFADLLAYTFVGLFFGNVLPSNLGGDVVRAYDLAAATRRTEDAAISVLVDRLMGLVAFFAAAVVMAVLTLILLGGSLELEQIVIWVLAGLWCAAVRAGAALQPAAHLPRRLPLRPARAAAPFGRQPSASFTRFRSTGTATAPWPRPCACRSA